MIGEYYEAAYRPIVASSYSPFQSYAATWFHRTIYAEDPWVSIQNHPSQMVYGENSDTLYNTFLNYNNFKGMNVFIRQSNYSTNGYGRCVDQLPLQHIVFGRWEMVRRVRAGTTFHPTNDDLAV